MVFERVVLSAGFVAWVIVGLVFLSGFFELSWWIGFLVVGGGGVVALFAVVGIWEVADRAPWRRSG